METTTGSSAQESVPTITEENAGREPFRVDDLARFCLVMTYADRMLERKILSVDEYDAFSVETAQLFGLKMPKNPAVSPR